VPQLPGRRTSDAAVTRTWPRRHLGPRVDCEPCGKQLHATRKAALDAAAHNGAEHEKRYVPYKCPVGPGFHLTTVREDA
jgi:hypothetical protein